MSDDEGLLANPTPRGSIADDGAEKENIYDVAESSKPEEKAFSVDVLLRCTKQRIGPNENESKFLAKLSHINMKGKELETIKELDVCANLKVLYLYENNIQRIENMKTVRNLTHLYLDTNLIHQIEDLHFLPNLQKLFLNNNCISRIGGLEQCPRLEELHVANQRLIEGEYLTLEEQSFRALSNSLMTIDLSGNGLEGVPPELFYLRRLEVLNLSKNQIANLEEMGGLFTSCQRLKEVDCRKNPMCEVPRYWEDAVVLTPDRTAMLDGKAIDGRMRKQMRNFEAHRQRVRRKGTAPSKAEGAGMGRGGVAPGGMGGFPGAPGAADAGKGGGGLRGGGAGGAAGLKGGGATRRQQGNAGGLAIGGGMR